MIPALGGLLIGAVLGALSAKRRGGTVADLIQWAVVGAIVLGLLGLFASIFLARSAI